MHFLFLLFLLKRSCFSPNLEGEYDGVNYSARDSMVMMVQDEIVTFYGDVKLTTSCLLIGGIQHKKERVMCLWNEGYAWKLIEGQFLLKTDRAYPRRTCYNLRTSKGFSKHAVTTEGELVFHAGESKRYPSNELHITNGKFTTCDADNPTIISLKRQS